MIGKVYYLYEIFLALYIIKLKQYDVKNLLQRKSHPIVIKIKLDYFYMDPFSFFILLYFLNYFCLVFIQRKMINLKIQEAYILLIK